MTGHHRHEPSIFLVSVVMTGIRVPHLLFLMKSGKGFGPARKASAVRKIIVTGRPSLARKAAALEAAVRRSLDARKVVPTLAPTFHLRQRSQALVGHRD